MSDATSGQNPNQQVDAAVDVTAIKRDLDEKQDRLLRALAEMDNMRRRAQRDREEFTRYATESLLRDLIPIIDNFDRALEAARGNSEAAKVGEGISLIQRGPLRVPERAGVERYSALGPPLDPTRHEATASVVSADAKPNTVVAE